MSGVAGGPSIKQGATVNRRPPPPSSGPLSPRVSASRHAPRGTNTAAAMPPPAEETFRLVPGGDSPPLPFSMIIKLAPSMVEEIRRLEAEGGKARIKFDSSSNPGTSSGNIIEVGGREFRFMWSREVGDLCDIYEERQNGEDGNGLLVESGCAWRKLNVQPILDESTTKHVKKMSEEAERKLRSRGTIVLEPDSPSMKGLAAVEAASRKNYNIKKEAAPKKRNLANLQVGGSSKSTLTPGSSPRIASKGKHSSPLSFIPDQPTASSSPFGAVNISKSIDDALPSQMIGKPDGNAGYEKGIPAMTFNAMRDTPRGKGNDIAKQIDLKSMLISLLRSKPRGLTLKALEKAVQALVPNPLEQIRPILGNIARYKPPGRYILLPGVDSKSLNKPQAEIESSSNGNHGQKDAHHDFHDHPAPSGGFKEKVLTVDLEEQLHLKSNVEEEHNALEKINIQHALPCIFGVEKGSDHSKRRGVGNSDGESGGDTGSQYSISFDTTGRGCSDDSESDASIYSKEGFDEDVDILSGDEEQEYEKALTTAENMSSGYERLLERQNYIGRLFSERENAVISSSRPGHSDHSAILSRGKGKRVLNKTPLVNRRGICLGRDPSVLKSGSTPTETQPAKEIERNMTFKHAESRANPSEKGKLKAVDAERANKFGVRKGIELKGCSESNMGAPTNLLEEVAGRGMEPRIAVENNGKQKGESSVDDDSRRYLKYEKDAPEFKGPIKTMAQYQEYVLEYNQKYPDYATLRANLKGFESNFEQLAKNLEKAKNSRDEGRFREILGQIKETYERHGAHHKRLKMIFIFLYQELAHLRQMITDFVDAQNKKNEHLKQKITAFVNAQNKKKTQNKKR